jgi:hypothetical protein
MAKRAKYFELLDFPKFAVPAVSTLQSVRTAAALSERVGGGGFMSYGMVWPRLGKVFDGLATDAFIENEFNRYKDGWKNEALREVVRLLRRHFGGRGSWYPERSKPSFVLGFWFKPSIKGIWFVDGQAYAVLINARKGQPLSMEDVRFLARGVYELHCIDDPNDPIPLIVDLSSPSGGKVREMRVYAVSADEMDSLESFDRSVREFLVALNLSGISQPLPPAIESVLNLFRRKP